MLKREKNKSHIIYKYKLSFGLYFKKRANNKDNKDKSWQKFDKVDKKIFK